MPPIPGVVIQVVIGTSVTVVSSNVSTTPTPWGVITSESNPSAVSITGLFASNLTVYGNGPVGAVSTIGWSQSSGETGFFDVQVVASVPATPTTFHTVSFGGDPLTLTPADIGSTSFFSVFVSESAVSSTYISEINPGSILINPLATSGDNDITFSMADGSSVVFRVTIIDTTVGFLEFLASSATKLLLVEMDYDGGTEYFGSEPWLSDTGVPYNDFLINQPSMDSSLRNFLSVGDVEAIHPDPLRGFFTANNWLSRDWRNNECRWYLGAPDWNRDQFRLILSTRIDSCELIRGNTYRFNLQDPATIYRQRWLTGPKTYNGALLNVMNQVLTEAGFLPPNYIGINFTTEGQRQCTVEADETTELLTVIQRLAAGMGAYPRGDLGFLQIIKPDRAEFTTPDYELDVHDMISFEGAGEQSANMSVDIVMHDGTVVSAVGSGDDVQRVDTYLNNAADAGALASELGAYYTRRHMTFDIESATGANFVRVGDVISHGDPDANIFSTQRGGIVEQVRFNPVGQSSTITIAHWDFS